MGETLGLGLKGWGHMKNNRSMFKGVGPKEKSPVYV